MILYDHPLSSYGQKVKIALREKGIAFACMLPEDFGTGRQDTDFAAANPRTEVPVLIVEGRPIFDSTIILDYLDERWPETPLMPRDPMARARQREIEEIADSQYEAVNWGFGEILWFRRAEGPWPTTCAMSRRPIRGCCRTGWPGIWATHSGSAARRSDAPMRRLRRWSIARSITVWARRRDRRWRYGTPVSRHGPPWRKPLPSSMRQPPIWRARRTIIAAAVGVVNIAITGWNG
ncbi:glutathione S-transferase family protein [Sphingomonas sp. I4]